ncbi:hypothetical protein HELRODRAFT_73661, partial [Helobdella robusta]|uniref:Sema domain-containing protein n=1 Tax=Helobdella robusta TaxID=6412 RepID=T1G1H0_HELRO
FNQLTTQATNQQLNQSIILFRNYLLRLRAADLSLLDKVDVHSDADTQKTCIYKGQQKMDCENFQRVLIRRSDQLLSCGTNCFAPACQWRKMDSLHEITERISGIGFSPYHPLQNSTIIKTSDDNFYSALVTDFAARDPAIFRIMGNLKSVRTAQFNTRWLNEPDFVSSYEVGAYVYFLFREVAMEYINCGKAVYSRVARICKNDQGGKFLLQDNWTSFLKARLNCSLPGSYPYYFNEIQASTFDESEASVYAVFTTAPNSVIATAVCVYSVASIDQTFMGPFKYQHDTSSAWIRVQNSAPHHQCGNLTNVPKPTITETSQSTSRSLVDAQKYQLMDRAVQSKHLNPIVVVESERYAHIAMHKKFLGRQNATIAILFLASISGYIDKMTVLPAADDDVNKDHVSCFVERIRLFQVRGDDDEEDDFRTDSRIKSMKIDTESVGSIF